ncbi:unnamed protein product, partial [marine sediment metagenome]
IESTPADIHDLPFKNNEFDVVLCSETLEHVADLHKAIGELLRVAGKAVVITVPHQPKEVIDKNIEEEIPHGHIHSFDLESFNFLNSATYHILSSRMKSPLLRIPNVLIGAMPREYHKNMKYPKIFIDIYNACVPILRKLFGKKTTAFLMWLNLFFCKFTSSYNNILFIILKDNDAYIKEPILNIPAYRIINFSVPYHYLKKNG